ncbi:F-box/FBD/LRR-repeat protein At1g13570-like isoform X2 [Phalaenopsis equestris]|nr:F-box/FBD/LRR-repeat protein At1g13570-like isoform X2 [Phalaenopsis equestris]
MEDRISTLPSNIIELILMCLPIAEAVRTSILSSRWLYQWCTIPNLIFDKHSVPSGANYRLESIVDQVLLLHIGPIHKFVFDVNSYGGIKDRWLIFLSRKKLKELALKCYRGDKIPTALYSCHAIESLDLYACGFKLPCSFNGFSCLTSLLLKRFLTRGGVFKPFPTYSCLKKVLLSSFNFEDQELVMTLGSLLQNTPVLRELQLEAYSVESTTPEPTSRCFDWKESRNFNLNELRMVRLTELVGVRNEMEFIEFILSTASRLESLIIQVDVIGHEKVELFKEIMRFRRSSPIAEIIILD